MTVGELIERLKLFPPDADAYWKRVFELELGRLGIHHSVGYRTLAALQAPEPKRHLDLIQTLAIPLDFWAWLVIFGWATLLVFIGLVLELHH